MTSFTNVAAEDQIPGDLTDRVQSGEVFVIRKALQRLDMFDEIQAMSLASIQKTCGDHASHQIKKDGIEYIHKHVGLPEIEQVTSDLYATTMKRTHDWASRIARTIFGLTDAFYYERRPNIRFHVPYDMLASDAQTLKRFASARGGGKLSAHPNHRDSWVGCPDNLINIWAAVAPIRKGNGLIVFPDAFKQDIRHEGASIARDQNPGQPVIPELDAGDAILFQGDHLHSSVLNRIDETRHAISFRIVRRRPNFSNGHYHHYLHSGLASGPLRMFAGLPANLAWSYLGTRLGWLAERLGRPARAAAPDRDQGPQPVKDLSVGARTFRLSDLEIGSIHALSDEVCVARTDIDSVIAFDRRCPHGGSDLSVGTLSDGQVTCPWHDLRFDPESGGSACATLKALQMYPVAIKDDIVTVCYDMPQAIAAE